MRVGSIGLDRDGKRWEGLDRVGEIEKSEGLGELVR